MALKHYNYGVVPNSVIRQGRETISSGPWGEKKEALDPSSCCHVVVMAIGLGFVLGNVLEYNTINAE